MTYGKNPGCCAASRGQERLVFWKKQDFADGPEDRDAWVIQTGVTGDAFIAVKYCPFCGTRLEE